jgi:hypothetical protein
MMLIKLPNGETKNNQLYEHDRAGTGPCVQVHYNELNKRIKNKVHHRGH